MNYANCYDMSVSDGGGGESWDAGEPEIIEDRPATIPDCTVAQKDGTVSAAYCDAILPNEEQSNRIAAVLTKMRAKGGECANIALFAEIIMDAQQFRMFDPQRYTGFAAAALGDGAGGIVMSTDFTTRYYDADHHSGEEPPRNLSTEIAHEVDHLLGRHHDPSLGTNARPQTANMYACSDLTP